MIIDEKHKSVPENVLRLARKASDHGISFSQTRSCLFVTRKFNKEKNIDGWFIVDSLNRGIYNSIYFSVIEKKFYMFSLADFLLYEYSDKSFVSLHAAQFFMPGITKNLVKSNPSKRNFI